MKKQINFVALLLTFGIIIYSCSKIHDENKPQEQFTYDKEALTLYRSYVQGNIQATSPDARKAARNSISKIEFNRLVDNYLAYEADSLIKNGASSNSMGMLVLTTMPISKSSPIQNWPGSTFRLQLNMTSSGTIASSSFAMSGLSGTMTQNGNIEQGVYQGVTTYKIWYTHSYSYMGITYTEILMAYGNVYNGEMTLTVGPEPV